jgi:hypothetical protein
MDIREWGETDAAKQWSKRCDEAFDAAIREWLSHHAGNLREADLKAAMADIAARVVRENPKPD